MLALAIGTLGFAIAGPLDLFLPDSAVRLLGGWAWLPMIGLYLLAAMLGSLLIRPRLTCWNVAPDAVRPIVEQELAKLDPQRRWAGSCVWLPERHVQLSVESAAGSRTVQLVSVGPEQDLASWHHLESELRRQLGLLPVRPSVRGYLLIAVALLLLAVALAWLAADPHEVQVALDRLLRR